jgi:hypothetical protein
MAKECSLAGAADRQVQIDLREHSAKQLAERAERAAKGLPPQPLPPGDVDFFPEKPWSGSTMKELRETNIACEKWLAEHPQAKDGGE